MRARSVRVIRSCAGPEGTALYEAVGPEGTAAPGPRVAVVGCVHGDESVGERVLTRLEAALPEGLARGSVLTVRANPEAARVGLRHTPGGRDLNRLWDRRTLEELARRPPESLCAEERRALDLAPGLMACDAVVDLHSSSRPSTPFLVIRDDPRHRALGRRLGVAHLVTGLHERAVLEGGLCSDVGLLPGEPSTRLGFTLEAGAHDDPSRADGAFEVVIRLLHALGAWRAAPPPPARSGRLYEIVGRFVQAPVGEEPWELVGYEGGPPGSGRRGPPRRLHSFETVEAGETFARRGGELARAERSFVMLLPSLRAAPGTELFFFARLRPSEVTPSEPAAAEPADA